MAFGIIVSGPTVRDQARQAAAQWECVEMFEVECAQCKKPFTVSSPDCLLCFKCDELLKSFKHNTTLNAARLAGAFNKEL